MWSKLVEFYPIADFASAKKKRIFITTKNYCLLVFVSSLPCCCLLYFFKENLSHKDIYVLGRKMSLGVRHLHHRDIALRNFLVSKCGTDVVISDFGLSWYPVTAFKVLFSSFCLSCEKILHLKRSFSLSFLLKTFFFVGMKIQTARK